MFRRYSSLVPHRFRGISGAFAPMVCEACIASVLRGHCVFLSREGVAIALPRRFIGNVGGLRLSAAWCTPHAGWQAGLCCLPSVRLEVVRGA